jgi:glucuronokinase
MIIKTTSYPRAALIGNPSDGYFGKTIAFTFSNFQADITLYPSEILQILPGQRDVSRYGGIAALNEDVSHFGYYGGVRLIKAAIRKFYLWCRDRNETLHSRNFTLRYHSNIPLHLGMAGSSAIIRAVMDALLKFYEIEIPKPLLANLILSVETEELGIGAGLQDRVAQVYRGVTYMDFGEDHMKEKGFGIYEPITLKGDLIFYIAYKRDNSEGSEVVHNDLRYRYDKGDEAVRAAMVRFGEITLAFRDALGRGDYGRVHSLMNDNFDLRRSIMNISRENLKMVELAREAGASAKFTGSGGALIGSCPDGAILEKVAAALSAEGIDLIIPRIA